MSGNDMDPPDPGENPEPESDGGEPCDLGGDVTEADHAGQSDQPEAISNSAEGQGTLSSATENSSDDPEGFQAPTGSAGRCGSPEFQSDSIHGAEGYPEGHSCDTSDGIAEETAARHHPNMTENDLEEEALQNTDNDQTEDSLEGSLPYREGEFEGPSMPDSICDHRQLEDESQNAEAENPEEDTGLFADNPDDGPSLEPEDIPRFNASAAGEQDCVEADNLERLNHQPNDEDIPAAVDTLLDDRGSVEFQVNQLLAQPDCQVDVLHQEENRLSESDPEENACAENFCNDSVEADSSPNLLQENEEAPQPGQLDVNINVSGGGNGSENPSGAAESEGTESSAFGDEIMTGSRQDADESEADVMEHNIGDVNAAAESLLAGGESLGSASRPLGDVAIVNFGCTGSGDEPEDSVNVAAVSSLRNTLPSDSDLCAPECDRPQTRTSPTGCSEDNHELEQERHLHSSSVAQSVETSNCDPNQSEGNFAESDQLEGNATEGMRDSITVHSSAAGDIPVTQGSQISQNVAENISVPPCQQAAGLLELEQVELPSRRLCPGISGSDLGDDFPRSADMLQSLTEGKDSCVDKSDNIDEDSAVPSSLKGESSAIVSENGQDMNELDSGSKGLHESTPQGTSATLCVQQNKTQTISSPHSISELNHSNLNNSSSETEAHSVVSRESGTVVTGVVMGKSSSVKMLDAETCVSGDDDLLSELDAELEPNSSKENSSKGNKPDTVSSIGFHEHTIPGPINGMRVKPAVALCEMSDEKLRKLLADLQSQMSEKESVINKLENERSLQSEKLQYAFYERDTYLKQLNAAKSKQQAEDLYLPQIKELEYTIAQQQNEIRGLKDKLSSHDAAAKRAVGSLQNELKVRVDQVTKMYEDCRKEKDSMVIKYAQAEHKNIELQKATEKAEGRLREILREREMFLTKAKQLKTDYQRTCSELETKSAELAVVSKELDKHKELVSSSEVRIKWAQNKMKAELDAHKETKKELEKSNIRIKEAKEETEQIRRDTQAIIKTYQESEEMKSISLDQRLKKKETELLMEKQEKTDQSEVYQAVLKELETLKVQYKDNLEELNTYKDKVRAQEAERLTNEDTMTKYKDVLQTQKKENRELQTKIDKMFHIQSDFDRAQDTIKSLDADIRDLKLSNKELQSELESCRKRESDLLHLTKKLTEKNAHLQSENTIISGQMMNLNSDNKTKDMELQEFETKLKNVSDRLEEEIRNRKSETDKLTESLKSKTKQSEDLARLVEEQKDEIKTLKRKHANNIKDLTRQLQQARRKLESCERGDKETVSMGSRTSSNGSLNTPQGDVNGVQPSVAPRVSAQPESPPQEYPVIVEQVEIDKEVLVNRIVKLQKAHARKNEKIEFMEDHINQLVAEVKKKKRIIQNYVLREEAGALSTENMDLNKAELSKRGGIMASVYSSHAADSHMNLELSLEINKKLQSVLEDTLLKNITLKENIDTLGEEIARLSQENRRLQLSIQGL